MAKISSTGKQFTITIPKDLMKIMGWDKDTEIIIGKYPEKQIIYIEKIKNEK
jgi:bifunctional DNA-binding transcriptional regulator/antitoxin component of YhaV-PrlF toxin-antitoxin module